MYTCYILDYTYVDTTHCTILKIEYRYVYYLSPAFINTILCCVFADCQLFYSFHIIIYNFYLLQKLLIFIYGNTKRLFYCFVFLFLIKYCDFVQFRRNFILFPISFIVSFLFYLYLGNYNNK